jgi:hypothetical protein
VFGVQLRDRIVSEKFCFRFFLTAVRLISEFCSYFSEVIHLGLVIFSWLCFQMNMNNYPHVSIAEDGRICSMGQHRPGFSRVLYDTLLHFGYNGDVPVYRYRMSMAHGLDRCEVSVMIPLNHAEPWMGTFIGTELDDTIVQAAQVALTSLCESRLAATAEMPNTLFLISNQGDLVWQRHLEAVSDLEGPHFLHAVLIQLVAQPHQDCHPATHAYGHMRSTTLPSHTSLDS